MSAMRPHSKRERDPFPRASGCPYGGQSLWITTLFRDSYRALKRVEELLLRRSLPARNGCRRRGEDSTLRVALLESESSSQAMECELRS